MDQKRKLKRRHLLYYLQVLESKSGDFIGHVADITAKGLLIIGYEPLEVNILYQLRIMLPAEIPDTKYLDVNAKSLWTGRDVNPDFFATGLELLDASQDQAEDIDRVIKLYGFND